MCPPLFLLKVTVKSQPTVHCGFTEQRPPTLSSTGFSCSTRNPQCVDVEGERKATHWLRPRLPDCPIQVTPAIMFLFITWQLQLQIEMWKITKSREKCSSCRRAERLDNCGFKMTKDESQWTALLVTAELCYWIHSISYPFQNDWDQRKLFRWRLIQNWISDVHKKHGTWQRYGLFNSKCEWKCYCQAWWRVLPGQHQDSRPGGNGRFYNYLCLAALDICQKA